MRLAQWPRCMTRGRRAIKDPAVLVRDIALLVGSAPVQVVTYYLNKLLNNDASSLPIVAPSRPGRPATSRPAVICNSRYPLVRSNKMKVSLPEVIFARGLAGVKQPSDLQAFLESQLYKPEYRPLI